MPRRFTFVLALLGLLLCLTASLPAQNAPAATALMPTASAKELPRDWFAFPPTSGEGMFNPVFLPFTCNTGDRYQAFTFPALLYYKFAFLPDNFSLRSGTFVFRRDDEAPRLTTTDPARIAAFVKRWSATHAVGGSLTAAAGGYTGTMQVYDTSGKSVLSKTYDAPLPYFTLMGRMVEDWMAFRGQTCSAELQAELERPMTTVPETLQWFGEAFGQPFRTEAEWALYQKILQADPNFAEVRYWLANQQCWVNGVSQELNDQIAYAAISHPVIPALRDLQLGPMQNKTLKAQAGEALNRFNTIVPDHNILLGEYISSKKFGGMPPLEIEQKWLPYAKKYPANWYIQQGLAKYYLGINRLCYSTPLYLSAAQSSMLLADAGMGGSYYQAGIGYWKAGQGRAALYCFLEAMKDPADDTNLQETLTAISALLYDFNSNQDCYNFGMRILAKKPDPAIFANTYLAALDAGIAYPVSDADINQLAPKPLRATLQMARLMKAKQYDAIPQYALADLNCDTMKMLYARACLASHRDPALAAAAARDAWVAAPRSPRMADVLAETMLKDHPQDIWRYAAVMCNLAPEISYWTALRARAKDAGAVPDTPETVTALLETWKGKAIEMDMAMKPTWNQAPPFIAEYLVMRALMSKQPEQIDTALKLFSHYAFNIVQQTDGHTMPPDHSREMGWELQPIHAVLTEPYRAHLRAFIGKVCNSLPEELRATWSQRLTNMF